MAPIFFDSKQYNLMEWFLDMSEKKWLRTVEGITRQAEPHTNAVDTGNYKYTEYHFLPTEYGFSFSKTWFYYFLLGYWKRFEIFHFMELLNLIVIFFQLTNGKVRQFILLLFVGLFDGRVCRIVWCVAQFRRSQLFQLWYGSHYVIWNHL